MTNPNRHLQPVNQTQTLIKLSCGHNVKANEDIFDFIPTNKVPLIKCAQCDRDQILQGQPAGTVKQHYSNIVGVKNLDEDDVRNVQGSLPFIMFGSLVYVSIEQSREYNGGF